MPQNTDRYFYIHSMSFEISDVRLGQKGHVDKNITTYDQGGREDQRLLKNASRSL